MSYGAGPSAFRRRQAQSYANVGLETQVMSARPEQLITLLLQGALAAISKARLHLNAGDAAGRGMALSKAIDIVESGLKASINVESGGDVANSLINSYDIIVQHLLQANLHADEDHLATAETMLGNILDAWRTAVDQPRTETT